MEKNIKKELNEMKFLFTYKPGVVLSEQDMIEDDIIDVEMEEQYETPVKPGIKTPTKPSKPSTPYKPKPGPKKSPKAKNKNLPDWLTFDSIGIEIE